MSLPTRGEATPPAYMEVVKERAADVVSIGSESGDELKEGSLKVAGRSQDGKMRRLWNVLAVKA